MSRISRTMTVCGALCMICGCGSGDDGQPIDVSNFDDFTFSRTIDITKCFLAGDLVRMNMTAQVDNRLLEYAVLAAAEGEEDQCLIVTEDGDCLIESELTTRVLVQSENTSVNRLFGSIMIANQPSEVCGAGNVTLCSEDLFIWDGLTVSGDFCQPVYVQNGFEVMKLLEDLRDGPPDETETGNPLDPAFVSQPIEIADVESVIVSDQVLGKNGDFVVIRTQSNLDGTLAQDGTAAIDFDINMGIVVVIIRPPCQEFTGIEATESLLTIDIRGTMARDDDCSFFDLGSIDAFLITIPKSPKKVRLFLSGSELDEIHL